MRDNTFLLMFFGVAVSIGGVLILRNRRSFIRMNPFVDYDESSLRWRLALVWTTFGAIVLVFGGIAGVIIALVNM